VQVFRLTAWFVVDMSTYFLKVISQLLTGGKKLPLQGTYQNSGPAGKAE